MEKRLNAKTNVWITDFKDHIAKTIQNTAGIAANDKAQLLQSLFEYPHLEFKKEDIQKRTRVKNTVPYHERCRALRANTEQCTRRKKDEEKFCGTHIKGTPHGEISDSMPNTDNIKKVQVWIQEIVGIIRHIDKDGNVYDPQDIYQNTQNPKVIAKWTKEGDKYSILG